ncbi:unnamed protein product [Adineta ricciae]|uniref:OTU domain-containing protein n=1 Tax=Adineta ricciae TaxID=249248 RepID=A0A815RCB8_ADIRI|nr:unnamed protein product [Adineta ricciae]CAF1473948.1 unnamed protein product [Adineta ricciae]
MAQIPAMTNSSNRTDTTNGPVKSIDGLRPHYYTTFQTHCCESKSDSTTAATTTTTTTPSTAPPTDILPVPKTIKTEAEQLLNHIHGCLIENLTEITSYTSDIPKVFFNADDHHHLQRYLIDRVVLKTMNEAHIINWNPALKQLHPIRTAGNGNCLLHAVLIAMVGIHDSNLYLRDRLAQFMDENRDVLKSYWRIERLRSDRSYGIRSEDSKLNDEWDEVCNLVHYEKSGDGQTARYLHFLEAVHIFSISNMLRRPIIVLAEDVIRNKNGEPISVNDLFGIYLPILSIPNECIREPIVLVYDHSHFCPLQTIINDLDPTAENFLPLYQSINHTYDQSLLPIRFLGDDISRDRSDSLLYDYLRIRTIKYDFDKKAVPLMIVCAELGRRNLSLRNNFFAVYHKYLVDFFEVQKPAVVAEEERKRQKQRDANNYTSPSISNDHSGWQLIRKGPMKPSPPSPAITPRTASGADSVHTRNRTTQTTEQRCLRADDNKEQGYVPKNGAVHFEKSPTKVQHSDKPVDPPKAITRNASIVVNNQEATRQLHVTHIPENIQNVKNNEKPVNVSKTNPQNTFTKSDRSGTEIPVRKILATPPASARQSASTDRHRDTVSHCLVCQRNLQDRHHSSVYCSDCEHRMQYNAPVNPPANKPQIRSGSTNMYIPGYSSALTPVPKIPSNGRTICPHCRSINDLTGAYHHTGFSCSACQTPLSVAYHY